jgi:hypothetical protein
MTRSLTFVDIVNNATSVVPLQIATLYNGVKITRGTNIGSTANAPAIQFVASGGSGTGFSFAQPAALTALGLLLTTANGIGTITGTPNNIGTFEIPVTLTDSLTNTFTINFTLTVVSRMTYVPWFYGILGVAGNQAPLTFIGGVQNGNFYFDGATLPDCCAGGSYPFYVGGNPGIWLQVSGNTGAVTYALNSGTLPTTVTLSAAGNMVDSGGITSPASTTPFKGVIRATDAGTTDWLDIPYSITVKPALLTCTLTQEPIPPYFVAHSLGFATPSYRLVEGQTYVFVFSATNGAGYTDEEMLVQYLNYVDSLGGTTLPPWITINRGVTQCILTITPPIGITATNGVTWNFTLSPIAQSAYGQSGNYFIAGDLVSDVNFITVPPQPGTQPMVNNSNVGAASFQNFNVAGGGVTASNDGTKVTYTFPTGAGGIQTISVNAPLTSTGGLNPTIGLNTAALFGVTTVTTSVTLSGTGQQTVIVNANTLTLTLPASPSAGDTFNFICTAVARTLTINPNGKLIETVAGNLICDVTKPNGSVINFALTYTNVTEGWSHS